MSTQIKYKGNPVVTFESGTVTLKTEDFGLEGDIEVVSEGGSYDEIDELVGRGMGTSGELPDEVTYRLKKKLYINGYFDPSISSIREDLSVEYFVSFSYEGVGYTIKCRGMRISYTEGDGEEMWYMPIEISPALPGIMLNDWYCVYRNGWFDESFLGLRTITVTKRFSSAFFGGWFEHNISADETTVKTKIQSIIEAANDTKGFDDDNLTDAVQALIWQHISTLIPKTVTGNGTYNAIDDGANGYSSVTVEIPLWSIDNLTITKGGE